MPTLPACCVQPTCTNSRSDRSARMKRALAHRFPQQQPCRDTVSAGDDDRGTFSGPVAHMQADARGSAGYQTVLVRSIPLLTPQGRMHCSTAAGFPRLRRHEPMRSAAVAGRVTPATWVLTGGNLRRRGGFPRVPVSLDAGEVQTLRKPSGESGERCLDFAVRRGAEVPLLGRASRGGGIPRRIGRGRCRAPPWRIRSNQARRLAPWRFRLLGGC